MSYFADDLNGQAGLDDPEESVVEERDDVDLTFQRYAFDYRIKRKGTSPNVDGASEKSPTAQLTPATFHTNTADKTLDWELERQLDSLGELLK